MDSASGPLKGIAASVQSVGKAASGIGATLGAGLGLAAGMAGFAGIAGVLGSAKGAMIDFNASMEQSQVAFTTMLGSGEKATAFLGDLQKFAATTPFEFPELQDAAKRMLAFGFQAKDVIPTMTAVGDSVAALGGGKEMINQVTLALGQMKAKGRVQGDEMLQLAEAGIPAWDMLAKKLGTDIPTAMAKVSKGAVSAETFLDAFRTGAAERFGGMMEKQSLTFNGAMSTINDVLRMTTANAFKPFFEMISAGALALSTFLQSDQFTAWSNNLASAMGRVATIVKALWAAFTVDKGGIGIVKEQLAGLFGPEFVESIDGFLAAFMNAIPRIKEVFAGVIETVRGFFGLFTGGATLANILTLADGLTKLFGPDIAAAILQTALTISDQVIPAIKEFGTTVLTVLGNLGTAAKMALGGDFAAALDVVLLMIEELTPRIADQVQQWGQAFLAWVEPMIPPMLAQLDALAQQAQAWIQAQAPVWAAQLVAWGQAFVEWVAPMIPPALDALEGLALAINGWIEQQEARFAQTLLAWARAFSTWVDPAIQQVPAQLANLAADITTWIVNSAITFAADLAVMAINFYAWVSKEVLPNLPGALDQIMAAISAWIAGAGPQAGAEAQSIGASLIDGLRAGIMARIDSIAATGAAAIERVLSAARAAADSHSPSMEMAKIGADLAAGLGLGIEKDTFKAVDSTKKLVDAIMGLARNQMQFAGRGAELFGRALDRLADSGRLTTENMQRLKRATEDYNIVAGTAAKQAEAVARAQKAIDIKRLFARPEELEFEKRRLEIDQARLDVEKAMAPLLIQRRQAEEKLAIAQKALDDAKQTKSERDDKAAQAAVDAAQDQVDAINDQLKPYEQTLQAIKDREDALRLEEEQFRITQRQAELGLEAELEFQKRLQAVFEAQRDEAQKAVEQVGELNDAIQRLPDSKTIHINVETSGDIPSFAKGGVMPYTGLALVHAGERIIPNGGAQYGGRSGDGNLIVNLTVQGSVVTEQDLVRTVSDGLIAMQRRGSGALVS